MSSHRLSELKMHNWQVPIKSSWNNQQNILKGIQKNGYIESLNKMVWIIILKTPLLGARVLVHNGDSCAFFCFKRFIPSKNIKNKVYSKTWRKIREPFFRCRPAVPHTVLKVPFLVFESSPWKLESIFRTFTQTDYIHQYTRLTLCLKFAFLYPNWFWRNS